MTPLNEAKSIDEIIDFIENYAVSASSDDFDKTESRGYAKSAFQALIKKAKPKLRNEKQEWCKHCRYAVDAYEQNINQLFNTKDKE